MLIFSFFLFETGLLPITCLLCKRKMFNNQDLKIDVMREDR